MDTKKLIKFNIVLFALYFIAYLAAKYADFSFFHFSKIITGIAIFLVAGFDCAVAVGKELKFDFIETLMIGVIISLFFIPLIIFLSYQAIGTLKEWLNFLIYAIVSFAPLIYLAFKENASRKI
jgi:hypothetical protein